MEFLNWVIAHKDTIVELWLAFVGLCSVIIKLFPVLSENHFLLPIIKFIGKYGALNKSVTSEMRPK